MPLLLRQCAAQSRVPLRPASGYCPEAAARKTYGLAGHAVTAHRLLRALAAPRLHKAIPAPRLSRGASPNMQMYVDARTGEDGSSAAVVG